MADPFTPPTCPNCSQATAGRFCSRCGQDNARMRLEVRGLVVEGLRNVIGWDSALVRTLKTLVRDPGGLAADYVAGRRRSHLEPARFCFVALALWLVTARLLGLDAVEVSGFTVGGDGEDAQKMAAEIRAIVGKNLDWMIFLALPLKAVLLRRVFRPAARDAATERNTAECLVLVLYAAGFAFLAGLGLLVLQRAGATGAAQLRPVVGAIWLVLGARTFFGRGGWACAWRVVLVTLLHSAATVVFVVFVLVPWVLLAR